MRVLICILALLVFAACGGEGSGSASEPLTIFAASSLTEVFPQLDGDARYQFAGSDDLALQLREGAQADVFAAASPKYPTELHDMGVVDEPVVFATNELILIVPSDNPGDVHSVDDLDRPGTQLVIGAEGVPVGDYTREILQNLGATSVLDSVVSEEEDVKAIVSKVALGEADAGFVYATDVASAEGDISSIELPVRAQPTVEYMVAVISDSDRKTEAQAFGDLLLSDEGAKTLGSAGFGIP